ncbi:MAG: nucleoside deaminase [Candidatus Absconditabacterales bacterium]
MNEEFMREAIKLSLENMQKNVGGPFGAVIVKDGKIVGRGGNQVTSSNDPTAHGEVVAIRDACKNLGTFDLHGCEIYTSCEPCPMCYGAISRARISKMYYANTGKDAADIGFDDSAFQEDIKKEFTQRNIPVEQICHDEALEVFKAWTAKQDKIEY